MTWRRSAEKDGDNGKLLKSFMSECQVCESQARYPDSSVVAMMGMCAEGVKDRFAFEEGMHRRPRDQMTI